MVKVLTVFGTRPEAIKLAPVIKELAKQSYSDQIISKVCVTGQHREMLMSFLKLFDIKPDYDLNIMKPKQTLFDITANTLIKFKNILRNEQPDIVLVQGDTNTAFAASLSAFYLRIKIGHVEAGLRSGNKYNPFPEEINRKLIDQLADLHFAPTKAAKDNLLKENFKEDAIFVTGNTIIDALFMGLERVKKKGEIYQKNSLVKKGNKLILVTGHRRESFGEDFKNICHALHQIVKLNNNVEIIYPVHLNPNVQEPVNRILGNLNRIHLIKPLDYLSFIRLMDRAYLILTDSGGVQEEAPSLGKPVLVMRNTTERPEVIEVGAAKLVGTTMHSIVEETQKLLTDRKKYAKMIGIPNPYGDGQAAKRIVAIVREIKKM